MTLRLQPCCIGTQIRLQGQLDRRGEELAGVAAALSRAQGENRRLRQEMATLVGRVQRLEGVAAEGEGEHGRLRERVGALYRELHAARRECRIAQEGRGSLEICEAQNARASLEIVGLRARVDQLEQTCRLRREWCQGIAEWYRKAAEWSDHYWVQYVVSPYGIATLFPLTAALVAPAVVAPVAIGTYVMTFLVERDRQAPDRARFEATKSELLHHLATIRSTIVLLERDQLPQEFQTLSQEARAGIHGELALEFAPLDNQNV